jgi:hypothetical protein
MKRIAIMSLLMLAFCLSAKDLSVLMIGNSFSICVGTYLPQMVKSVPGSNLTLTTAYIGGCSLETHLKKLNEAETNPKAEQYKINVWFSDKKPLPVKRGNILSLLKTQKYDIITIQQNSSNSINYKTFQPFADQLIAVIKKYQPKAEIVIQQTWSYRADSAFLEKLNMNNDEMYQKLSAAYAQFAKDYSFRVIPVGDAVQLTRKYSPVKFQMYDRKSLPNYIWPDMPPQSGDVVGKLYWAKRKGKLSLLADATHLNTRGEYLQAAVWFAFVYDKNTSEIKFIPSNIGDDDAAFMLKCAQEAVSNYKQITTEK